MDGDFMDIDRLDHPSPRATAFVFHGLGGDSRAPYVMGVASALLESGFNVAAVNFRGCSGESNRLPQGYHCGASDDALQVITLLEDGLPQVAVGFSLGGNVVGRVVGEMGASCPLAAAVTVSAPFDLRAAVERMDQGLSRGYQQFLLLQLKRHVWPKRHVLESVIDVGAAMRARNFKDFDDLVTAPLHGYVDAHDYWARASAGPLLRYVEVPTLVLHSEDDPFMPASVVPPQADLSPSIDVRMQPRGGHVGFMGASATAHRWWMEATVADWLQARVPDSSI
jgi:hypothetical protein